MSELGFDDEFGNANAKANASCTKQRSRRENSNTKDSCTKQRSRRIGYNANRVAHEVRTRRVKTTERGITHKWVAARGNAPNACDGRTRQSYPLRESARKGIRLGNGNGEGKE
jgi:hypothetical protein